MGVQDDILYKFSENHDGVDHIQRVVTDITTMAEDVHKIFNALPALWQGHSVAELQASHHQINQKLEEYLQAVTQTASFAGQQQDDMQQLDIKLSQGF